MEHTVSHDVGLELAKKATVAALKSYETKYSQYRPRATWTSETTANVAMNIRGVGLEGRLDIREREIALTLDVPFIFRPFRARAVAIIEGEINAWLAKARAGEVH